MDDLFISLQFDDRTIQLMGELIAIYLQLGEAKAELRVGKRGEIQKIGHHLKRKLKNIGCIWRGFWMNLSGWH